MSLRVWLPLNGDLHNQGLSDSVFTNDGATIDNNGKIGKCYSFASGNSLSSTLNLSATGPWSAAAWIYPTTSSSGNHQYIIGLNGTNATNFLFTLCIYDNKISVRFAGTTYSADVAYTTNIWYHACFTYDGTQLKIYVDGVLNKTYTSTVAPVAATNLYIGKRGGNTGYYVGKLNDVRIYDHVLSDKEIEELSKGLVLHYKLDYSSPNLLHRYVTPGQQDPGTTATAGRTEYNGDYSIIIPATENKDTYFRLFTKEQMVENTVYTISCQVSGLLEGTSYSFPLLGQGNASMGVLKLNNNGLCSLTFTMNSTSQSTVTIDGQTWYICFMDDSTRTLATGQGPITVSNFKLEKGSVVSPWCSSSENNSIIYDTSGYGNHGTIKGTLVSSSNAARYNCSTIFDGDTAAIQTPNLTTMITDQDYTISCWTYKTQIGTKNYQTIYGGPSGFELEARSSSNASPLFRIHNWGGSTTAYEFNKWYHFCFVHSATDSKLYINGELKITGTSATIPSGNYFIGAWKNSTTQNYDGNISDFRIYATSLTEAQVKELYHTSATIDRRGNLYSYKAYENNDIKISRTGIIDSQVFNETENLFVSFYNNNSISTTALNEY